MVTSTANFIKHRGGVEVQVLEVGQLVEAYENTTPSGNASPGLIVDMAERV